MSDTIQGVMRLWRKLDGNGVARPNNTAAEDDTHDARFPNEVAIGRLIQNGTHQTCLTAIELCTWITEASHLNDGVRPNFEPRSSRQIENCYAASGDVLPHDSRSNIEAPTLEVLDQFLMDQVDLTKVRLRRIGSDA